jgi:hypothetical protein
VPFLADAFDDALGRREGMPTTRRLVARDEIVVGRVEVHDPRVDVERLQLLDRLRQLLEEDATADVDHDRDPRGSSGS